MIASCGRQSHGIRFPRGVQARVILVKLKRYSAYTRSLESCLVAAREVGFGVSKNSRGIKEEFVIDSITRREIDHSYSGTWADSLVGRQSYY